jgi:hypothetical protein
MTADNHRHLTRDQKKELLLRLLETLRDTSPTPMQATSTKNRLYRITLESGAVLDYFDRDINFTDVFICSECLEIRGSWKSHGEVFVPV